MTSDLIFQLRWPAFEAVVRSKSMQMQYSEDSLGYHLLAVDGVLAYVCVIYTGAVPVSSGVTQEENDGWKVDFEDNWKDSVNRPLVPRAGDGKAETTPNLFPAGTVLYLAGRFDHATNGRGAGGLFEIESEEAGDVAVEGGFNDVIWLAGGAADVVNGQFGDRVTFEAHAPATPITPNGSGTGNVNLVDGYLIVPAAGNGAFDLDFAAGVPLPARDENNAPIGYWEWTYPMEGKGTVYPAVTPGKGGYFLIAGPTKLAIFANSVPLATSGYKPLIVPAITPKPIFPQWTLKVILHNSGHTGLKLAFHLVTARSKTV